MSTFAFLLLCVQACLIQNVCSQYLRGPIGPAVGCEAGLISPAGLGLGVGLASPAALGYGVGLAAPCGVAAYGGAGVGDVAVGGEMGVAGNTLVAGQVPILGGVEFGGIVPAAGAVSIAGSCGCGCNGKGADRASISTKFDYHKNGSTAASGNGDSSGSWHDASEFYSTEDWYLTSYQRATTDSHLSGDGYITNTSTTKFSIKCNRAHNVTIHNFLLTLNMFKSVLLVCAQALFVQSIAGQFIGAGCGAGPYGFAGTLAGGCGCGVAVPASSGGGLGVASASPISPNGVSVLSENAIEGPLAVAGALPFLGTVALEGVLPTAGAGAVNYGCGNGAVAIVEELAPAGLAGPLGYGLGPYGAIDGIGYGIGGLAGPYRAGCGCGALI
ncbi:fibroin heavy chain-like [Vanessa atalanta]|nr:fibroin heavy chain-like [Vanessa atalanta]